LIVIVMAKFKGGNFPGGIKRNGQVYLEIHKPGYVGRIPQLGFGTWLLNGEDCYEKVLTALELGYRHIDTADVYNNHKEIARALKKTQVPRDNIFITSKVSFGDHGTERTSRAIDRILSELELDFLDLLLIHFPGIKYDAEEGRDDGGSLDVGEDSKVVADREASLKLRIETWRAMEEALQNGKTKFIGVSNYELSHLKELQKYAKIPPAVNQVELHPFLPKTKLQEYCRKHKIILQAYGSVVQNGAKELLNNKIVGDIAEALEKSEAQVGLKWAVMQDLVVLPKSSKDSRIKENMDIFDWELRSSDQVLLMSLDCNSKLKEGGSKPESCIKESPCGKHCYGGTFYWDPSLVPAVTAKSTILRITKEVDQGLNKHDEL